MRFVAVDRRAQVLREPVTGPLLERLCRQAFGEQERLAEWRLLDSGHFNTSYYIALAGRAPVILRLAPGPGARLWRHETAALRRQYAVQGALAALGAVIPQMLYADFSRRELPRDFAFFECLEGELWADMGGQLDARQQAGLWAEYGALVRRLHAIRGTHFGFPAPLSPYLRFGDWVLELAQGLAADLRDSGLAVAGIGEFADILRTERDRLDAITEPRLVHGDLWPRNVLIRSCAGIWQISGLLDAERAYWGDPASEWIFGFLDIPREFWASYGSDLAEPALDRDALWRRRVYQARGALQLILDGQRFGYDTAFARAEFSECLRELRDPLHRPAEHLGALR